MDLETPAELDTSEVKDQVDQVDQKPVNQFIDERREVILGQGGMVVPSIPASVPTGTQGHVEGMLPGGERCRCGCIPNIMGTFEMAALRAKRRQEKADAERKEKGQADK